MADRAARRGGAARVTFGTRNRSTRVTEDACLSPDLGRQNDKLMREARVAVACDDLRRSCVLRPPSGCESRFARARSSPYSAAHHRRAVSHAFPKNAEGSLTARGGLWADAGGRAKVTAWLRSDRQRAGGRGPVPVPAPDRGAYAAHPLGHRAERHLASTSFPYRCSVSCQSAFRLGLRKNSGKGRGPAPNRGARRGAQNPRAGAGCPLLPFLPIHATPSNLTPHSSLPPYSTK